MMTANTPVSAQLIEKVINARHELHRKPELSLEEKETSQFILSFLSREAPPDQVFTGIGGNGVIALYNSGVPGPVVMFRAELDALPIIEINSMEYKSQSDGVSHKCGHDGHMATVLGLAGVLRHPTLSSNTLRAGQVIVLFQPAEEVGSGAASILADKTFTDFIPSPDFIFAFHNVPGQPIGSILLREGSFSASVRSMVITFHGKTSHAAEPENGISPSLCIACILVGLDRLANNNVDDSHFRGITPVHVSIGERGAYGVTPGYGELHVTVRTWTEDEMENLLVDIHTLLDENTQQQIRLKYTVTYCDVFFATNSTSQSVNILDRAAQKLNYSIIHNKHPMKWGEDFGHFTQNFPGAFFGIGAGVDHSALHNPDYDFPDEILEVGVNMFVGVLEQLGMVGCVL